MTVADPEVYYDPYDFEIDTDPYPVWKRLRDEKPLYYNEKHDFYALSRFADVEKCSADWKTYISGKGTLLEIIKMDFPIPPGSIIFEDPPDHDVHRAMLSRVFRPKAIAALEPKIREFCARSLDPLIGAGGFDFVGNLGAEMPMRTIGYLLGIPEEDQEAIRHAVDASLRLDEDGKPVVADVDLSAMSKMFEEYIEWRTEHPSDDLMTEMLNAEFEDVDGTMRKLNRDELLGYINLIAAAGNETTTRLIGWAGKVLAEHPDQRADLVTNPEVIPNAIEELLRYEAPSPVQARYMTSDQEHYGQVVPQGNVMLLLTAAANRDERKFADPDKFDVRRKIERHVSFGYGVHFCLGASLARLEGRIALEEVLKRFPTWDVDYDNAIQARTSTVRGWEKLPVTTP
jgi:cytochrome P450